MQGVLKFKRKFRRQRVNQYLLRDSNETHTQGGNAKRVNVAADGTSSYIWALDVQLRKMSVTFQR